MCAYFELGNGYELKMSWEDRKGRYGVWGIEEGWMVLAEEGVGQCKVDGGYCR